MKFFAKPGLLVALLFILTFVAIPSAKADPLQFSNVVGLTNGGATRVDLFYNPGATINSNTTSNGQQVSFLVDITGILPPNTTNTLLATYTEIGRAPSIQTYSIPVFGTIQPPFTLLMTFNSSAGAQGTLAALSLNILGSPRDFVIPGGPNSGQAVNGYTYVVRVRPVPEPATILVFGTGLLGLATKLRKRRQKGQLAERQES